MKKFLKKEGITLIALIITIIVLLILAGVTINMLTGDNGILKNAQSAARRTELAQIKEQVELLKIEEKMGKTTINSGTLEKALGTNAYKKYAEKIYVLGGTLVYDSEKCSEQEIKDAKAAGVKSMEEYTIIRTAEDLKAFRDDVDNGNTYEGKEVYLMNNITLDITEEWNPIGYYDGADEDPNEELDKYFKGIFDGCGNEIDGIYINNTNKAQGLFGMTYGATIKNLGIGENSSITGGGGVGGIAGYIYNGSIVDNCYNKAKITGEYIVGGLVGLCEDNQSQIKNSYNEGTISGPRGIGGIVGQSRSSIHKNCLNFGDVFGVGGEEKSIGGILGIASSDVHIEKCKNMGKITGDKVVGGIVGTASNNTIIKSCVNNGIITGNDKNTTTSTGTFAGGILGGGTKIIVEKTYNTADVFGVGMCGGIAGAFNIGCTINECFNTGNITATGQANEASGGSRVGGIARTF